MARQKNHTNCFYLIESSILHPFAFFLIVLLVASCGQNPRQSDMDTETYSRYLAAGNEVSGLAQTTLLSNVSKAMEQGGSLYAVEFCNLEASGITDSLNNRCNCEIVRISAKNRNPENGLKTDTDEKLWAYFMASHRDGAVHDTLVQEGQQVVYYKPILTAMPACLQCHGPVPEINLETYSKIRELYPDDQATGYGMNELRGLWKISFTLNAGS
jgi:hypothetical protein